MSGTALEAVPRGGHGAQPAGERDLSVDVARIGCLLIVVALHVGMVGIGDGAGGGVEVTSPLTQLWFFAVGTWVGQVMPLFFVLGGYGAYHSMRRQAERGTPFATHLRSRVVRLGLPAVPFFAVVVVAGLALAGFGVPQEMSGPALDGAGDPLWFMAAFLICQGFVRAQYRLVTEGKGRAVMLVTVAGVAAVAVVDLMRHLTTGPWGTDALGLLNMLTVWPLLQLLGMAMAHGMFSRVQWWGWVLLAGAGWCATAGLASVDWYSPDMLTNLNPPTLPLLTVGVMHVAVFRLLSAPLRRLAQVRAVQAVLLVVGARSMHLYLWHLLVIIVVNGLIWVAGVAPEPGSPAWWWTRIPVYLLVVVLTLALTWGGATLERARPAPTAQAEWVAWVALAVAVVPQLVITRLGLDLQLAALGLVLTGAAVLLVRPRLSRSASAG